MKVVFDADTRLIVAVARPVAPRGWTSASSGCDHAPGRAQARILDVTDHDQVTAVVNEVTQTVGPVDVLVNNAGYGVEGLPIAGAVCASSSACVTHCPMETGATSIVGRRTGAAPSTNNGRSQLRCRKLGTPGCGQASSEPPTRGMT
ncbi:SDR family NAD(P)-dependent oxidoreductase [Streptomyces sp. NPDC001530]|uniref:SDR family NAD(P)-dependent oxidoreductase n=1 Tax=Streptomyces sp. NPDC001530 TaxID=3364582 RepID=UPI0036AB7904